MSEPRFMSICLDDHPTGGRMESPPCLITADGEAMRYTREEDVAELEYLLGYLGFSMCALRWDVLDQGFKVQLTQRVTGHQEYGTISRVVLYAVSSGKAYIVFKASLLSLAQGVAAVLRDRGELGWPGFNVNVRVQTGGDQRRQFRLNPASPPVAVGELVSLLPDGTVAAVSPSASPSEVKPVGIVTSAPTVHVTGDPKEIRALSGNIPLAPAAEAPPAATEEGWRERAIRKMREVIG